MVEVTQADREAAAEIWNKLGMSWRGERLSTGGYDDDPFIQWFARHREQAERETVARIVAWLRGQHQQLDLLNYGGKFADAIEAGEWNR